MVTWRGGTLAENGGRWERGAHILVLLFVEHSRWGPVALKNKNNSTWGAM